MVDQALVSLVEGAAKARGDEAVPEQFIKEALRRIEAGDEKVGKYPTGQPSLRGVFVIALRIKNEESV